MDLRATADTESRFVAYVEGLVSVIGHADRAGPLRVMTSRPLDGGHKACMNAGIPSRIDLGQGCAAASFQQLRTPASADSDLIRPGIPT